MNFEYVLLGLLFVPLIVAALASVAYLFCITLSKDE